MSLEALIAIVLPIVIRVYKVYNIRLLQNLAEVIT